MTEYYSRVSHFVDWIESEIDNYKHIPFTRKPADESSPLNKYAGQYENDRRILIVDGLIKYKRGNGPYLTLKEKEGALFEFVLPDGVVADNQLPNLKFIYNQDGEVSGFELIHSDRTELVKRKN